MTAKPAKFMFGTEFGTPKSTKKVEELEAEIARLMTEIEAAETRGFETGRASGFEAGRQHAEAIALARIADALESIASASGALLGTMDAERGELERQAIDLALATGRTIGRTLMARQPLVEIEALASDCLAAVRSAPHLVMRVAPDLVEAVEARMKRLAFERGYEGRLVVIGSPDVETGDCRIEWADGGMVRDTARIEQDIERAVRGYVEARAAGEQE